MNRVSRPLLSAALLAGLVSCAAPRQAPAPEPPLLRHMVAFRFHPEVTPEQMQKATDDFLALREKVPQIVAIEGGADFRIERKKGRFTHAFVVTVRDSVALKGYGGHPDHRAFSASVNPLLAEVAVVDYWTRP